MIEEQRINMVSKVNCKEQKHMGYSDQIPPPYTLRQSDLNVTLFIETQMNWSICNLIFSIITGGAGFIFSIFALIFSILAINDLKIGQFNSTKKYVGYSRIFNIMSMSL